jgi:translation initiation factor 2D
VSPPLAVGRMSVSSSNLQGSGKKGKAVLVIHTWKDHLWEMGSKQEVPEDTNFHTSVVEENDFEALLRPADETQSSEAQLTIPSTSETECSSATQLSEMTTFTPQKVTEILNKSLLQAITESISPLPPLAFPMAASIFYLNHILPSRPAYPTLVVQPDGLSRGATADPYEPPRVDTEITIKSSGHKSLTSFLKAAERSGLLNLKSPQKQQPDVLVTSVNSSHPSVLSHESFVTIKALELKAAKKAAREAKEREAQSGNGEIYVQQLWKPYQVTVDLFEDMGER